MFWSEYVQLRLWLHWFRLWHRYDFKILILRLRMDAGFFLFREAFTVVADHQIAFAIVIW